MMVQESLYATELKLEEPLSKSSMGTFDEFVLASIDESLSSIGKSVKREIYLHLKESYGISFEDIPSRISDFAEALEKSFGLYGKFIEIEIMKTLHGKAGPFLFFPHGEDLAFADYIETLRCFV